MTRWLITGAGGLLAGELRSVLRDENEPVCALDRAGLDVCDPAALAAAVRQRTPDVVVNCAATTDIGRAEADEGAALAVNGTAVRRLAEICAGTGASLIHISTDYVFGGAAREPYGETAEPGPCNAYGRTKLAGERAVLDVLPETGRVLRTAWLYGSHGRNFVQTMIRLERRQRTVDVVDDQWGQPTWARDLAERIVEAHRSGAPAGIYHATNSGQTTWHGLAQEVFRLLGADTNRVRPVSSAQWGDPVRRPAYSVLGHDRWSAAGMHPMREWRAALARAFPQLIRDVGRDVGQAAGPP